MNDKSSAMQFEDGNRICDMRGISLGQPEIIYEK
jgi:hypothetical protein